MTNMSYYHYNECQSGQLVGGISSYSSSPYQYYHQSQQPQQQVPHSYSQRPLLGASNANKAQLTPGTAAVSAISDVDSNAVVKTQIETPEGTYKLMTLTEFSRPSRMPLNVHQNVSGSGVGAVIGVAGGSGPSISPPVRVSFASTLPTTTATSSSDSEETRDFICYNIGRELYVYTYGGASKVNDLSRPIDKRVYKGSLPTCHDFNRYNIATESCPLLVGFSAGQIQLFDPFKKDGLLNKLFNEERLIDKTRCTCVKWIPGSPNQFLVAHSSGSMYVYNEDLAHGSTLTGGAAGHQFHPPVYQPLKHLDGLSVFTCKSKSSRNPVYKWAVGRTGQAINEFAFSPDSDRLLATVGQDGFLRVFNFHSMECVGAMRSYFGALLCLSWSPDSRYIATGGEDDLITIYSVLEKQVVCRGQGHKSWVSQIAFDPYLTIFPGAFGPDSYFESEEDLKSLNLSSADACSASQQHRLQQLRRPQRVSVTSIGSSTTQMAVTPLGASSTFYRLGSVGQDTMMCMWDLTEDTLKPVVPGRNRTSSVFPYSSSSPNSVQNFNAPQPLTAEGSTKTKSNDCVPSLIKPQPIQSSNGKHTLLSQRFRRHFMGLKIGDKNQQNTSNMANGLKPTVNSSAKSADCNGTPSPMSDIANHSSVNTSQTLLGSRICPNLKDVPIVEPLVIKKIALDRLTVLVYREDCLVTACQEGFVCTWARPDRHGLSAYQQQRLHNYNQRQQHHCDLNSPHADGSSRLLPDSTVE